MRGKPQIFGSQVLKPSEMCITRGFGAHLANHVLEILIWVPVKDDDKAVNDDMGRRWVLETGVNRVVVE